MTPVCANCGAPLSGIFCQACGQKVLTPRERGLAYLLGEAFQKLTDIDGALLRSLRLLLFSPGVLSREYMEDRRVRYASPVSMFLLANVLYFFSPALSDFNLPFEDQVTGAVAAQTLDPAAPESERKARNLKRSGGQLHSRWTEALVHRKVAALAASQPGYDLRQLASDYDQEAAIVGKVLIITHVPIIAMVLALVYWRRRHYYAEHFVVALHVFTFLLLFAQVVVAPLNWSMQHFGIELPANVGQLAWLGMTGLVCLYMLIACRKAYRVGWGGALAGLVALAVGLLFGNIVFYRALQFVITLALI